MFPEKNTAFYVINKYLITLKPFTQFMYDENV